MKKAISTYRGNKGKVRQILSNMGFNPNAQIFNDVRAGGKSTSYARPAQGVGRRIKVWFAPKELIESRVAFNTFINQCKVAFGENLIDVRLRTGTTRGRGWPNICIYLKDA